MTALITQPELDPQSNGRALDEIFFEDYGFKAIYRTNNSSIVAERYQQAMKVEGCVIVESGHRWVKSLVLFLVVTPKTISDSSKIQWQTTQTLKFSGSPSVTQITHH